jgi:hypothetical protein
MAVQHPPAPPFTLTDQQADIVLRACKPLRPAERRIFLQRLADQLERLRQTIDDALLDQAIEQSRRPGSDI